MKPVNAKQLNRVVTLQKAVNKPDGYGGFTTSYEDVKTLYVHLFDKNTKGLDSTGQWIWTNEKRLITRYTNVEQGNRFVIGNEVYSVKSWKHTYKQTQIEVALEFVGFNQITEIVQGFRTRVINNSGTFEAAKCL